MNKILNFAAVIIIILSLLGLTYFVQHPIIDSCARPSGGDPYADYAMFCRTEESTNWTGIGISLAISAFGIVLAVANSIHHKKQK